MTSICFYFQVHQPFRLKQYDCFQIGTHHDYYDDLRNESIFRRVAEKCYLPMNAKLLSLIRQHKGKFKVSFSISGTALLQMQAYAPETISSFQQLAATGCVEFLGETFYHSLASVYSKEEFIEEINPHRQVVADLFGKPPMVFRNTELIYSNDVAKVIDDLGFTGVLCEGTGAMSENFIHSAVEAGRIKCLLRNCSLSDDISFRFSDSGWDQWPLTPEKYSSWIFQRRHRADVINLFMDYETFGEHQDHHTGITEFISSLSDHILNDTGFDFKTPSEIINEKPCMTSYDLASVTSWADREKDLSAWIENPLQESALERVYKLQKKIKKSANPLLLDTWRKLLTSDHFYYMSTKTASDGQVHQHFSPYRTPYDAYINYMNVLTDFEYQVDDLKVEAELLETSAG
jgi:alpha-amylase